MGIEMFVFGFRKLSEEEIDELTFKSREDIVKSDYWRNLYPKAPYGAGYWFLEDWEYEQEEYNGIKGALSPVETADYDYVYVCWREKLGYFWHKDSNDRRHIESILDSTDMNWDEAYHEVPYVWVGGHLDASPTALDKEIIAFSYG